VVDWTSPKVIASPTQRYLINCVIEKIHKTIQKHCIMSTVRTSKVVFSEEEEFTCDLENTSKNIEGAQEESTPAPSRGQKRERTKRNLGGSIRRSDGSSGDKQPEWTTMRRIEDSRLDILKKVELPFWRILAHYRGTCLKGLSFDPLVWLTMSIFVGVRVVARLSDDNAPQTASMLSKSDITILGGFLSFFLVFFVNQTNERFLIMYRFSKSCNGRTQDVAGLASVLFPPELGRQIVRHMNAAHIAGYVGLGGPYSKRHFFDHYNKKHNLLTPAEMDSIAHLDMESGSDIMKELVTWCQHDVGIARRAGIIDSHEAKDFHDRILTFRTSMDGIYDYCDQPPHFFYIHFLCLLSAFYLPLFAIDNAYSAGWGDNSDWGIEVLNGVIVLLQSVFVIGLRLLGQKMVDPYGDDPEDLSVISYVEKIIHITEIMLTSRGSHINPLPHKPSTFDAYKSTRS